MSKEDLILFCAFRYALGRSTHIVEMIVSEIIERWDALSQQDRDQYLKEIREAIQSGRAGMKMDIKEWNRMLEL